jgi:hypothetical protein
MKMAANSMDEAQKIVRKLDPKSKFKFTRLPKPLVEEIDENKKDKDNKENIVDEKETVIV